MEASRSPGQDWSFCFFVFLFSIVHIGNQQDPGRVTLRSYLPPALECLQPSDGHNGATYITVVFAGAEVVVFEKVPPPQKQGAPC